MNTANDYTNLRIDLGTRGGNDPRYDDWAAACDENIRYIQMADAEIADMNAPILAARGPECRMLERERSEARKGREALVSQCHALQARYSDSNWALLGAG